MTTIGPYYSGKEKIGQFTMPTDYVGDNRKRGYRPGPQRRPENYWSTQIKRSLCMILYVYDVLYIVLYIF